MEENSPMHSKQTPESTKTSETSLPHSQNEQPTEQNNNINIEEEDKPLPPSFHHTLTEETLCNNDCP